MNLDENEGARSPSGSKTLHPAPVNREGVFQSIIKIKFEESIVNPNLFQIVIKHSLPRLQYRYHLDDHQKRALRFFHLLLDK